MRGGKAFYSPMTKSQSLVSIWTMKFTTVSQLFPSPLGETEWLGKAVVGFLFFHVESQSWLKLGYCSSPRSASYNNTLAVRLWLTSFPGRQALLRTMSFSYFFFFLFLFVFLFLCYIIVFIVKFSNIF